MQGGQIRGECGNVFQVLPTIKADLLPRESAKRPGAVERMLQQIGALKLLFGLSPECFCVPCSFDHGFIQSGPRTLNPLIRVFLADQILRPLAVAGRASSMGYGAPMSIPNAFSLSKSAPLLTSRLGTLHWIYECQRKIDEQRGPGGTSHDLEVFRMTRYGGEVRVSSLRHVGSEELHE
jgi:hypothetical protein